MMSYLSQISHLMSHYLLSESKIMKLVVKNFGPIVEGEIDLTKKLYIFVGYNNSGKTYMSQLLWAIFRKPFPVTISVNMDIEDSAEKQNVGINENIIQNIMEAYLESLKKGNLSKIFNVSKDFFVDSELSFKPSKNSFMEEFEANSYIAYTGLSKQGQRYNFLFEKKNNSKFINIQNTNEDEFNDESYQSAWGIEIGFLANKLQDRCTEIVFNTLHKTNYDTFFLPSNRSFYPAYYKYIYSSAKEEKSEIDNIVKNGGTLSSEDMTQIRQLAKQPYTLPMDILTEMIYKFNTRNVQIKKIYSGQLYVLRELLGGDIILKSSEGIAPVEFFLKTKDGKELDMYLSSASVNQLATLYLYFKYWVSEKRNFLFIDEPEQNLHPKSQLELLDTLIEFAQEKDKFNRVLISTHSPLLTEAINNYLILGSLAEHLSEDVIEQKAAELGIANLPLTQEDIGIYFFNGSRIIEYTVGEYGTIFHNFKRTTDTVLNASYELGDYLSEILKKAKQS